MRKTILLLFLLAPSAIAITENQTKQVQEIGYKMQDILNKMMRLAASTQVALGAGNLFRLDFSTKTYTLTAGQQTDITNYYNNLKTQLQAQLDALP